MSAAQWAPTVFISHHAYHATKFRCWIVRFHIHFPLQRNRTTRVRILLYYFGTFLSFDSPPNITNSPCSGANNNSQLRPPAPNKNNWCWLQPAIRAVTVSKQIPDLDLYTGRSVINKTCGRTIETKQHRQCVTTVTCRSVVINSAPYLLVLVLYHITLFSTIRPEGSNPPHFYMTGRNDENEWPFRSCSAVSRLSRTRHPQNDLLRIRIVFSLKSVTFNGGRNDMLILTTERERGLNWGKLSEDQPIGTAL